MAENTASVSMHVARTAMNREPEVRAWVEEWLKARERVRYLAQDDSSAEAFETHWKYVRPETMHDGALEGYTAYLARSG